LYERASALHDELDAEMQKDDNEFRVSRQTDRYLDVVRKIVETESQLAILKRELKQQEEALAVKSAVKALQVGEEVKG
jgi:hypothetical protein